MKKIRVAILGQGRSGFDIHGQSFLKNTDYYQVVACADLLASRRKKAQDNFGCDVYDDYSAVLDRDDIDLVVNSLPSHMHVPVTKELLKKGFNVISEKPAARYAHEVDELIALSKSTGCVYAVFQQSRFANYFTKVKEVIDSGKLGRIIQVKIRFNGYSRRWDWQCCQEFNGGSLLNTGPHPMDQALQFLNYDGMPDVKCYMDRVNTFGDAEDYVKLLLTAKDRPVIDLEISSCSAYPSYTFDVQGSRGGLRGTMMQVDWRYYNDETAQPRQLQKETLQRADGSPTYCEEELDWTEESWTDDKEGDAYDGAVIKIYDNLYHRLTDGTPLIVTAEQVRQQIAVMEECHRQNPLSKMDEKD